VAWHRAGRVWTLFAVGGKFADAPVEKLELQDGVLRVTIHPEGQKAAIWEYDAKTGKWREVPP
jgi:hypothetical protein